MVRSAPLLHEYTDLRLFGKPALIASSTSATQTLTFDQNNSEPAEHTLFTAVDELGIISA